MIGISLRKSSEEARGQLTDISQISACEEFQQGLLRNQESDVKDTLYSKEHTSPIVQQPAR